MKLLKLLASKMDKEEQKCLPLLLNCFYYRETLFIVYELLRDNLYHMYARADRTRTLIFGPSPRCAREHALERAPHTRPAVPATSTSTSAGCQSTSRYAPQLHEPSEAPCPPPCPHTRSDASVKSRPLRRAQVERVQEVARQCLSTLVSLHKNDVIHCDLVRHDPI